MNIKRLKVDRKKLQKLYRICEYLAVLLAIGCLFFNDLTIFICAIVVAIYCAIKRQNFSEREEYCDLGEPIGNA